jgi:hypothetical protein
MNTYTDTAAAATRNNPENPAIRKALAGHEHEAEILALLATDPEYSSAVSNGYEISDSQFSDGGLQVAEQTGFLNGLIRGVPYQAPKRSPEAWTRYLARCQRDARIRGIEFAFTRDGKARTQRKPRAKSRLTASKAKAIRAKLAGK